MIEAFPVHWWIIDSVIVNTHNMRYILYPVNDIKGLCYVAFRL